MSQRQSTYTRYRRFGLNKSLSSPKTFEKQIVRGFMRATSFLGALFGLVGLFVFTSPALAQASSETAARAETPPTVINDIGKTDLSGLWRWSIDPYSDGYAGFHGGEAGYSSRRYNFITVEEEMRKNPTALFEYDMDTAKTAQIPGAWIGHEPEMRHYHGLVWYQHEFDIAPKDDERIFLEFGAVNY